MEQTESKTETETKEKKTSKGKLWMWIWLISISVFILSFIGVFGSFNIPLLLSIPIGGISLLVWAFKSKAGRRVMLIGILLLALFFFFHLLVARPQKLVDNLMSPAFSKNDCVWTEKASYYFHSPQRGDLILYSNQSDSSSEFYGRIVGLPNESVSIKPGEIKINGNILNDSHINWGNLISFSSTWPEGEMNLKDNEYFVMLDNFGSRSDLSAFQVPGSANITVFSPKKEDWQKVVDLGIVNRRNISGRFTSIKYFCN